MSNNGRVISVPSGNNTYSYFYYEKLKHDEDNNPEASNLANALENFYAAEINKMLLNKQYAAKKDYLTIIEYYESVVKKMQHNEIAYIEAIINKINSTVKTGNEKATNENDAVEEITKTLSNIKNNNTTNFPYEKLQLELNRLLYGDAKLTDRIQDLQERIDNCNDFIDNIIYVLKFYGLNTNNLQIGKRTTSGYRVELHGPSIKHFYTSRLDSTSILKKNGQPRNNKQAKIRAIFGDGKTKGIFYKQIYNPLYVKIYDSLTTYDTRKMKDIKEVMNDIIITKIIDALKIEIARLQSNKDLTILMYKNGLESYLSHVLYDANVIADIQQSIKQVLGSQSQAYKDSIKDEIEHNLDNIANSYFTQNEFAHLLENKAYNSNSSDTHSAVEVLQLQTNERNVVRVLIDNLNKIKSFYEDMQKNIDYFFDRDSYSKEQTKKEIQQQLKEINALLAEAEKLQSSSKKGENAILKTFMHNGESTNVIKAYTEMVKTANEKIKMLFRNRILYNEDSLKIQLSNKDVGSILSGFKITVGSKGLASEKVLDYCQQLLIDLASSYHHIGQANMKADALITITNTRPNLLEEALSRAGKERNQKLKIILGKFYKEVESILSENENLILNMYDQYYMETNKESANAIKNHTNYSKTNPVLAMEVFIKNTGQFTARINKSLETIKFNTEDAKQKKKELVEETKAIIEESGILNAAELNIKDYQFITGGVKSGSLGGGGNNSREQIKNILSFSLDKKNGNKKYVSKARTLQGRKTQISNASVLRIQKLISYASPIGVLNSERNAIENLLGIPASFIGFDLASISAVTAVDDIALNIENTSRAKIAPIYKISGIYCFGSEIINAMCKSYRAVFENEGINKNQKNDYGSLEITYRNRLSRLRKVSLDYARATYATTEDRWRAVADHYFSILDKDIDLNFFFADNFSTTILQRFYNYFRNTIP